MKFLLARVILTTALMSGSIETNAANPTNPTIGGQGGASCDMWTAARRNHEASAAEGWVIGYLSGIAMALFEQGFDPLKGKKDEDVFAWVDGYCRQHPLDRILAAVTAFVATRLQ